MIHEIKIPRSRTKILIKVRESLEKHTKTNIIPSVDGDVEIDGAPENLLIAVDIVKAIGRGFSPEIAFELLNEKKQLAVITVKGTENTIKRLMSRVIGRGGTAKRNIERLTESHICIFGKTVSVIGESDAVTVACTAVEDLLSGRKHAFVYSKLEKIKRLR